jgi:hypothetical protein
MTDQILRRKNEGDNVNRVPQYEEIDEKSMRSAPKDSNNDYSTLSMTTLNKDGIYSGREQVTGKESKQRLKYTRMVCCLALSAGVATLVVCFIAICATLFAEIESSTRKSSATHADLSMIMLQLQQNISSIQDMMQNENSRIEAQLNMSVDRLNHELDTIASSIRVDLLQHSDSLDELRHLHPGQTRASPVSSCATLTDLPWSSPSGYYTGSGPLMVLLCVCTVT